MAHPRSRTPPSPLAQGTAWLIVCAVLSLSTGASAQEQTAGAAEAEPLAPEPEETPTEEAPSGAAEPAEHQARPDAAAQGEDRDEAPAEPNVAGALSAPVSPPPPGEAEPRAPWRLPTAELSRHQEAPPRPVLRELAESPTRGHPPPRWWRMPREMTRRPLTLPGGVVRADSTLGAAALGNRVTGVAGAHLGVGILDDLEIGATPLGVSFPIPITIADPSVYVRARLLSGEIQIALRGDVWIPIGPLESQINARAELAWTPEAWFRLEAALEYGLQFGTPVHQRISAPVRVMFQAGPNAFAIGTGLTVWNDGDDVDVPLVGSYTIVWHGYQGPTGEATLRGGAIDITGFGVTGWFVGGQMTWYAYF